MQIAPDKWLPLEDTRLTSEGRLESRVRFGPSSEWFSGHFDGSPLLPGVALLALVAETVKRQALESGRLVEIAGFSKVRFKHLVFPDEELFISVSAMPPVAEARLDFQITCHGVIIAQGFLKAIVERPERGSGYGPSPAGTQKEDR